MPLDPSTLARHGRRLATAGVVACLALTASAARVGTRMPAPGEYTMPGGNGTLTLKPGAGPGLAFEIETVGGNGHTCSVDGEMRNGHARVSDSPAADPCIIRFAARLNGIDVSTNDAPSCRSYCGARADFVGRYLLAAPGCTATGRAATGAEFKALYDLRDYRGALPVATRLLERCADAMDRIELGSLRNDLAVTQYHLGQRQECLRTLAPLIETAGRSDATLQAELPPADFDNLLPIVHATRTNLRLCRALRTP